MAKLWEERTTGKGASISLIEDGDYFYVIAVAGKETTIDELFDNLPAAQKFYEEEADAFINHNKDIDF